MDEQNISELLQKEVVDGDILMTYLKKIAGDYLKEDYISAGMFSRKVLENIVNNLMDRADIQETDKIELKKKISQLSHLLPQDIDRAFEHARKLGNSAIHQDIFLKTQCEEVFKQLDKIIKWYLNRPIEYSIIDVFIAQEKQASFLMQIDNQKTLQVVKAYGESLLKKMDEETLAQFKQRISNIPKINQGQGRICSKVIMESKIVPLQIVWFDKAYEQEATYFYVDFEGLIDPNIFNTYEEFEVQGKYTIGKNSVAIPDYKTLTIKIGNNSYPIHTLNMKKSMFETAKAYTEYLQSLGNFPVGEFLFDQEVCDKACGVYKGTFRAIVGSVIKAVEEVSYYFHSDVPIDCSKSHIVFTALDYNEGQAQMGELCIKIREMFVPIITDRDKTRFVQQIQLVPVGEYEVYEETTDLSTGFIHIRVNYENTFFVKAPQDYILILGEKCEDFNKKGYVYGNLEVRDEQFILRTSKIVYNGTFRACLSTRLMTYSDDILKQLMGMKIPVAHFKYLPNGYDRITGYCSFDVTHWFEWTNSLKKETEFFIYKDLAGNTVTGTKGFVYGEIVERDGQFSLDQWCINIDGCYYDATTRNLYQSDYETSDEYLTRIVQNIPVGMGNFDKAALDIEQGTTKFNLLAEDWYKGVVPPNGEIYAIALEEKSRSKLTKQGQYTVFAKDSQAYNGKMRINPFKLTVHVDEAELYLLVIPHNLKEVITSDAYVGYCQYLQYICAGHIQSYNKDYNPERHLFDVPIVWNKWVSDLCVGLDKGQIRIEPEEAKRLFEQDLDYNIYVNIENGVVSQVFMFADQYYEMGFEQLGNLPIPYTEEVVVRNADEKQQVLVGIDGKSIPKSISLTQDKSSCEEIAVAQTKADNQFIEIDKKETDFQRAAHIQRISEVCEPCNQYSDYDSLTQQEQTKSHQVSPLQASKEIEVHGESESIQPSRSRIKKYLLGVVGVGVLVVACVVWGGQPKKLIEPQGQSDLGEVSNQKEKSESDEVPHITHTSNEKNTENTTDSSDVERDLSSEVDEPEAGEDLITRPEITEQPNREESQQTTDKEEQVTPDVEEVVKPELPKPEETKPEETKPEEAKPELPKVEETKPEVTYKPEVIPQGKSQGDMVAVEYTEKLIQDTLRVTSLKMQPYDTFVKCRLVYESTVDSQYRVYEKEPKYAFIKSGDLPKTEGQKTIDFALSKEKLLDGEKIVIEISDRDPRGFTNSSFIELSKEAIKALYFGPEIKIGESKNIRFSKTQHQKDLKIHSLVAQEYTTYVEFTLKYETAIERYYSFFNPPNGDVLMISEDYLQPTDGAAYKTFRVEKAQLKGLKEITMKFYNYDRYPTDEENTNFIFLEMADIRKIS